MSNVMSIYVKFTKTTHQIWSCHVILPSNSENFYFSPKSVLNFRKVTKFWGKLAQKQKGTGKKTNWGWKTTPPLPVLIGLELRTVLELGIRAEIMKVHNDSGKCANN